MPINNTFSKACMGLYASRILCLLLLCCSLHACAAQKGHKPKSKAVKYALTVVSIRPVNTGDTFVKVSFQQSARFYKLYNDADPAYMELLKESLRTHTAVMVSRASETSDVIVTVTKK